VSFAILPWRLRVLLAPQPRLALPSSSLDGSQPHVLRVPRHPRFASPDLRDAGVEAPDEDVPDYPTTIVRVGYDQRNRFAVGQVRKGLLRDIPVGLRQLRRIDVCKVHPELMLIVGDDVQHIALRDSNDMADHLDARAVCLV
jgi:hypothetical protein